MYSDSAVVSWPPACSYMTKEWSLEACPIVTSNNYDITDSKKGSSGISSKPEYSCVHMDLSAESTVHMPKLLPCKFYQFRLKAFGDLLWTFAPSRTLPTPQVDSKSFTTSIHLTITQNGDCDAKALVHHWRVQYCEHEDNEHDNEIVIDGSGKSTILHISAGLEVPNGGSLHLEGIEINGLGEAERANLRRSEIGIVFQQFNLIPSLTVEANIGFQAALAGRRDKIFESEFSKVLDLCMLSIFLLTNFMQNYFLAEHVFHPFNSVLS